MSRHDSAGGTAISTLLGVRRPPLGCTGSGARRRDQIVAHVVRLRISAICRSSTRARATTSSAQSVHCTGPNTWRPDQQHDAKFSFANSEPSHMARSGRAGRARRVRPRAPCAAPTSSEGGGRGSAFEIRRPDQPALAARPSCTIVASCLAGHRMFAPLFPCFAMLGVRFRREVVQDR